MHDIAVFMKPTDYVKADSVAFHEQTRPKLAEHSPGPF
jgi:hypothetical protein